MWSSRRARWWPALLCPTTVWSRAYPRASCASTSRGRAGGPSPATPSSRLLRGRRVGRNGILGRHEISGWLTLRIDGRSVRGIEERQRFRREVARNVPVAVVQHAVLADTLCAGLVLTGRGRVPVQEADVVAAARVVTDVGPQAVVSVG